MDFRKIYKRTMKLKLQQVNLCNNLFENLSSSQTNFLIKNEANNISKIQRANFAAKNDHLIEILIENFCSNLFITCQAIKNLVNKMRVTFSFPFPPCYSILVIKGCNHV